MLEKTLESPLDSKVIQPVHSKGDQSWVFFGRTNAKGETSILWPPHVKSCVIGKVFDAGRDWGQDRRGWDGWMASLTQWTSVWVNSGSWWWTGRPGMLQFTGSQRVRHHWATELNWTENATKVESHCFITSLEKNDVIRMKTKRWLRTNWIAIVSRNSSLL